LRPPRRTRPSTGLRPARDPVYFRFQNRAFDCGIAGATLALVRDPGVRVVRDWWICGVRDWWICGGPWPKIR